MSYTPALDVSQWQGAIDFTQISEPIVIIKFSGGDGTQTPLYLDSQANHDYYSAKAAGKAIGIYHFLGPTSPTEQADFFLNAASPLDQNDVLCLDFEIETDNPVGRCQEFIQHLIDKGAPIPLIYMDTDRENRFDWSPVINQNVGLCVADYRYGPEDNVPIKHWPTYVMHQFNSSPIDHDAFFGTVEQFKAYGWHDGQPAGTTPPPPNTTPISEVPQPPTPPAPTPPAQTSDPVPVPEPIPPVIPPPVIPPAVEPPVETPTPNFFEKFIEWLLSLIGINKKG